VLDGLALVRTTEELGGYLGHFAGAAEGRIPSELALRWSSRTGLGFVGGTGFEPAFPARRDLGALTVRDGSLALERAWATRPT
jgi:hypothetical protein